MSADVQESAPAVVTVHVPMVFVRRGGRRQIVAPDGALLPRPKPSRVDNTLLKALARAFRWRKLLENGSHASIDELARAEGINPSYVSRILRLTLLAPSIVEAIPNGEQAVSLTLAKLMRPFSIDWQVQHQVFSADL